MSREERLRRYVLELRRKLSYAAVDDVYRRARERDRKAGRFPAYKLVRNLPSVSVRMDGTKNHHRPHVHISVGKQKHVASLAIDNGELLAGRLKPYELTSDGHRSPGHHVEGGSLAEILFGRSATRWLRL